MQTDATTHKVVGPTMLGVGSGVQTDATTPNNVGTCSVLWEGYKTRKSLETMNNARAWPQQCWKNFSCANGSYIVALRFDDLGTKEMLGVVGSNV